jgi:hypothetical protein
MPAEKSAAENNAVEELAAVIARTGLAVPERERADILTAWPYLADLRARVRRDPGYADEPAHVFIAAGEPLPS